MKAATIVPHTSFDRVFKDIMREALIPFMKVVIGLELVDPEELNTTFALTERRDADFLFAHYPQGEKQLVEIEVQSETDSKMPARMLLYLGHVYLEYNLLPRQYVLYLGEKSATKPATVKGQDLHSQFHEIWLCDLSAEMLLQTDHPATIILSLLANTNDPESQIDKIGQRLAEIRMNQDSVKKYVNQLIVCANLRNIDPKLHQKIQKMPINLDITKSLFYQDGLKEGEIRGERIGELRGERIGELKEKRESVLYMFYQENFTIETIARIARISVKQAQEIIDPNPPPQA